MDSRNYVTAPFRLIPVPREAEPLAEFIELYSTAICQKVLPSLSITFQEREELEQLDFELLSTLRDVHPPDGEYEEFCGGFGDPMLSSNYCAEHVQHREMELAALQAHILGLAFAGLFHIFERQVLMILLRLNHRRHGDVMEMIPTKERHTFVGYMRALDLGGYPITGSTAIFVERLRLISNVMKHGTPRALQTLFKNSPELYWPGSGFLTTDAIQLTPKLLAETASALAQYWRDFPHE